jgi:hypothetical protein
MAKSIIPTFITGIISPELASSIDLDKARSGLIQCENFIIDALGGVKNRPGTQFGAETQDLTKLSRLIPFQFNIEQAYILEFGDLFMRVWKDGAVLLRDLVESGTYQWTLSTGGGTTEYYLEASGGGDPGDIFETLYVLENGSEMTNGTGTSLSPGEWDYGNWDGLGFSTFYVRLTDSADPDSKADGYVQIPIDVASPYPIADVAALNYTQSADVVYIFHPDYRTRKVTRSAALDWTITEIFYKDGPYKGRVIGDSDITVKITRKSPPPGWLIGASDPTIFDNYETAQTFRAGFPIPGDLGAVFWSHFTYVPGSPNAWSLVSNDGIHPAYEQIQNYKFANGINLWEEHSDVANGNTLTYDATNIYAVLTHGSAGSAKTQQIVTTFTDKSHLLQIRVSAITGTSPTVVLNVGTAPLLGDIFTTTITATGLTKHDVLPTQETIYVSLDSVGSTSGDTISIDYLSLHTTDVRTSGSESHSTNDWRISVFNATAGYPALGIFNEQRLIYAKNYDNPQTIWPSQTANFEYFTFNTPILETDSFSFNPPTPQINGIEWLALQNGLNIGTAGELWKVFAASGGVITPTDVNIKVDSAVGTLALNPLVIGNSIILTPRGKEEVAELTSSFESSGYVKRDLSVLASHLFKDRRIIRWAYAREPDSVIWCILDNGKLLGLTYFKEYDIWAWHEHTTPIGEGFKDIAVIPNSSDDNIDDVYFIINRGVDGAPPKYYIEQLNRRITSQEAAFGLSASGTPFDYKFLDSALTLDNPLAITNITTANPGVVTSTAHGLSNGDFIKIQNVKGMTGLNNIPGNTYSKYKVTNKTANTFELWDKDGNPVNSALFGTYLTGGEIREMILTVSGLDHLETRTVTALADGRVESGLTVSSGQVTLRQAASFAHIGLPYESVMETPDVEILADTGSTQGRYKSITKAYIYFKDTRGAEVASSNLSDEYRELAFFNESDGEDPPALFTGSKEVTLSSKYRKTDGILVRQTKPLPIEVKRIIPDGDYVG